jgi:uncharacterized protein (DUF2062 family)
MLSLGKIKQIFKKALLSGWSAKKLALSASFGTYIAFSPFPGGHTIIMLAAKWMFKLNFPILFFFTSINNPWTMIPFCTFEYAFGYWFLHHLIGWHPSWIIPLEKIFGSGKICIWSFFIGGNILGIFAALVSYPILNVAFKKISFKFNPATVTELGQEGVNKVKQRELR